MQKYTLVLFLKCIKPEERHVIRIMKPEGVKAGETGTKRIQSHATISVRVDEQINSDVNDVYIEHHTIQNTFSSFIIIRFGG